LDNVLQKNAHHNEQVDYYEKKIDSLNTVKNELNSQVTMLSQLKTEIQNLNFKLTTTSNETSETKQMIRFEFVDA